MKHMRDKKSDNESLKSSLTDRRSGTDQEGYSSSGDTYFTAELPNSCGTSGRRRPISSDVDAMFSAVSKQSNLTTDNSEYITCHDLSSADTSQLYSAASTLSSRNSVKSSESSGHLGSIEVSECSETLVESSLEFEARLEDGTCTPQEIKPLEEYETDRQITSETYRHSFETFS